MARLLWTIWALMLHSLGLPIFRLCFANDYCEPLVTSPPITAFLFATSVYIIVVHSTLFPESFRKPNPVFMCLYEFLVTAFFLEFAVTCLWTPIDVLVVDTLPQNLSNILFRSELTNAVMLINKIEPYMPAVMHGVATTILLLTLHVTKAVDFKETTDNGVTDFLLRLGTRLWRRIPNELPRVRAKKESDCRCNVWGKGRRNNNKSRASKADYYTTRRNLAENPSSPR